MSITMQWVPFKNGPLLPGSTPVSSEMLISAFETGSRISVFQSRASRREREFLSFSLMLRDENEIFFLSVSCFETRTGISLFKSRASRQAREFFNLISGYETRSRNSVISSQFSRHERDFWLFHENFLPFNIFTDNTLVVSE